MSLAERAHTSLDQVWGKVCTTLRGEVGEEAYGSYLAQSRLRSRRDGALVVVTHTGFARDWLRRNAFRRLGEVWVQNDPERRRLDLRSKLEFEAEGEPDVVETTAPEVIEIDVPVDTPPSAPRTAASPCVLQERFTFDAFVSGSANAFAYDTARQVADGSQEFNPVVFHGPFGQGKTHLLTAIALEAQRVQPDKTVMYMTSERFTAGFLRALQEKAMPAFKERLRAVDLLLIDDVHFVGNKQATQEELFQTITWLVEEGRKVVLSSDRPPVELAEINERLRSHLAEGIVCGLQSPDRAHRMAIAERRLETMARAKGLRGSVKLEVLQFLADRFSHNVRELVGAVNTVFAQSADRLPNLSVDEVQLIIRPHLKGSDRRVTVDEIQKAVAAYYGLKQDDLLSPRRTRAIARPRQFAMHLAKTMTTRSYPDIGRRFGNRDHTTVLHAIKVVAKLIETDPQAARDIEALTRTLRG